MPLASGIVLNAGNLSVNGMREANNGFLLNGCHRAGILDFGGTSVIPNLDSHRRVSASILTNNFDAGIRQLQRWADQRHHKVRHE